MAACIIGFVGACMVGLIFVLLGIHQCKSESPVTMNTGEKPLEPEQLTDVKAWNTGHGKALVAFGIAIAVTLGIFPIGLYYVDAAVLTVITVIVVLAELVGLMANHNRLERKYRKTGW